MKHRLLYLFLIFSFSNAGAQTNPAISSWIRNTTGLTGYNCSGCSPAHYGSISANVTSVYYDATYAYISVTGVPSYNVGPWPSNPNVPSNQNKIYKILLAGSHNATHNTVPLGLGGLWSNGVGVYNPKDGFYWNNVSQTIVSGGSGTWNRNAYVYEGASFDACLGHADQSGSYHNHVNPKCLYTASASSHSPIIGYAFDGYPIYGAYGYSSPLDNTSAIKLMVSSYVLSAATTRTNGPNTTSTYSGSTFPAGSFCEDYVYSAGAGDLDQYNGRTCVTPEYPLGTYAYFVTINATGTPQYPFVLGPTYYGVTTSPNTVASIPGGAVQYNGVLPVETGDFTGRYAAPYNQLQWTTFSESSSSGFDIEYSKDGHAFSRLDFVPTKASNGSSSAELRYDYLDTKTVNNIVYYRLKQLDRDGGFKYSNTIVIRRDSKQNIYTIFPNPITNNTLNFSVSDNSKPLTVNVVDYQGRTLITQRYEALGYSNTVSLPMPYLNTGIYWVIFSNDGNKMVKKIVLEEE